MNEWINWWVSANSVGGRDSWLPWHHDNNTGRHDNNDVVTRNGKKFEENFEFFSKPVIWSAKSIEFNKVLSFKKKSRNIS